jgi:hypothetical protein
MEDSSSRTLSDVIGEHHRLAQASDSLLAQRMANDQAMAARYIQIRDALKRPDLRGAALVDRAAELVYVADQSGVVVSYKLVWSDSVPVGVANHHDFCDDHSTVTTGEAS